MWTAEWEATRMFFALQGLLVLLVNYRGSTGAGQDALESLAGHCGTQDVADVIDAIDVAVAQGLADDSPALVAGGSHGGFLACHLVAQHPPRFRAAIARNPVVNLQSMFATSDIPDWCVVEGLGLQHWNLASDPLSPAQLEKLYLASPIAHIRNVKAPTLVVLGLDDRRVPNNQGLQLYHALRNLGVNTKLLTYEGNNHAITKVESEGDAWVHGALWFLRNGSS